ncbi:hydroxysqualene dehydroxylase HpnE [bacterium]|nr:hydroxysqualene dehydroxylase HpnE [bacterium]
MRVLNTIVVGGGFAGLTAATRLNQAGADVILLERNRDLGGRASSFFDKSFNEWLDNGSHVFLGAYNSALSMLKIWGGEDGVDFSGSDKIPFIFNDGSEIYLDMSKGGGRFKQALGILKFRSMTFRERLNTVRVIKAIINQTEVQPENEPTVAEFIAKYGIIKGACYDFLDALTVSIMNSPIEITGIKPLAAALMVALSSGKSNLGIPIRPFQQLYIDPVKRFLTLSKVDVRTSTKVKSLLFNNKGDLCGVETAKESIPAESVLLALPPFDLIRLLPDWLRQDKYFARFSEWESSSILTVHLIFDRPVLQHRFAYFPNAFPHWIFGREQEEKSGGWRRLSAVTSYAPKRDEMSNETIKQQVISDINERLPLAADAEIQNLRIVRTSAATWLLKPGSELLRPSVRTPVKGLYLAGDWCATGLPLTIESAARSGERAAEAIIS